MKLDVVSPMRASPAASPLLATKRALPVIPHDPVPALVPAVAPEAVRAGTDRFRCEPYNAVIFARVCVERQKAAGVQDNQRGMVGGRYRQEAKLGDYSQCRSCAVGASIRKRLAS